MRNLLLALACLTAQLAPAAEYRVVEQLPLPGDGSWDYLLVDSPARRLYVSHFSQTHVLNVDTGQVLGSIPGAGVHGVAIVPQARRGYITNGTANNVTVFNTATLAVIGEIPAGKKPDAILYEPLTRHVFVNNNGGASTTVLDGATGKLVTTLPLGGAPETSVSDLEGSVYTNLEDTHELVRIDARTLRVVARWKLAPCETPTGLALDRENARLFVGCRSHHFAVVDARSGKVLHTAPIGDRVDAVAFDAESKRIYLSNGDGTVNVFHQDSADKYSAVETITTSFGGKTMALDPKTGLIYVSVADYEPLGSDGKTRPIRPGTFRVLVIGTSATAPKP